jgi:hypothetical protein
VKRTCPAWLPAHVLPHSILLCPHVSRELSHRHRFRAAERLLGCVSGPCAERLSSRRSGFDRPSLRLSPAAAATGSAGSPRAAAAGEPVDDEVVRAQQPRRARPAGPAEQEQRREQRQQRQQQELQEKLLQLRTQSQVLRQRQQQEREQAEREAARIAAAAAEAKARAEAEAEAAATAAAARVAQQEREQAEREAARIAAAAAEAKARAEAEAEAAAAAAARVDAEKESARAAAEERQARAAAQALHEAEARPEPEPEPEAQSNAIGGSALAQRAEDEALLQQLLRRAEPAEGDYLAAVPPLRRNYCNRNSGLTEISLRVSIPIPILILMTWSRYGSSGFSLCICVCLFVFASALTGGGAAMPGLLGRGSPRSVVIRSQQVVHRSDHSYQAGRRYAFCCRACVHDRHSLRAPQ